MARQAAALKNKKEETLLTSSQSSDTAVQSPSHSALQLESHNTVHSLSHNKSDHSLTKGSDNFVSDNTATSPTRAVANNYPSATKSSPLRHIQSASPIKNVTTPMVRNGAYAHHVTDNIVSVEVLSAITPTCAAALVVSTMGQLSPAPVTGITQLSSPSTIAAITVGSAGTCTPGTEALGLTSDGASELEEKFHSFLDFWIVKFSIVLNLSVVS